MEGLFACLPGRLAAWRRRCSQQASVFRRHLGPGPSLPGGQQRPCWEASVKQQTPAAASPSSVTDHLLHHHPSPSGLRRSMPPPSRQEPVLRLLTAPSGSHQQGPAALEGLDKKKESKTNNVRNATAAFHSEEDTGENGVTLQLNVKGISSSPDTLCDCVALRKIDGNAYANKDGQAVRGINVAKSLTQVFVKVCGKEVSMQEDFHTTTIKELIDFACRKAGIQSCGFYATYGGKRLKDDNPIGYYPIFRDSTVHLRSRLRGGRQYECVTFKALMGQNKDKKFHQVNMSALSQAKNKNKSSVSFLSEFSAYYIQKIMVYVCGIHREGRSFDGNFTAENILIINKTMVVFDTNVRDDYVFSEATCKNDYMTLYKIFVASFIESAKATPKYFKHFLDYLFDCPAGGKSNSEPLMKFITNHPALTSYMDRIKQCVLLDSMVRRLSASDLLALRGGDPLSWQANALKVPALEKVFIYDSLFDKKIHQRRVINADYTGNYLGCLRFARNYFSHAENQMKLPEVDAAFAEGLEDFLPNILMNVAKKYTLPADFDKLTLLGNPLSDSFELLSISYPTASQLLTLMKTSSDP